MKILIATKNLGKLKEYQALFSELDLEYVTLNDLAPCAEPIESGLTLFENALIKAFYYYKQFGLPVISDDTGLFVDGLDGAPGVNTARYSGLGDQGNRALLLKNLEGKSRNACFKTALVFYDGTNIITSLGVLKGEIAKCELGEEGFGYDKVFYVPKLTKTLAQIPLAQKNLLSHRFKAINNLYFKLQFYFNKANIIDYIKSLCYKVFNIELSPRITKLSGGMSNDTYLVTYPNSSYTVRIPGLSAELFVDRWKEQEALDLVQNKDSFLQYLYFDSELGVKISPYLAEQKGPLEYDSLNLVLHQLHELPKFKEDYLPFKRLEYYERLCQILGDRISTNYYDLKKILLKYQDMLISRPMVSCHNDCQLSNYIASNAKYTLIDFEFVGNNDYLFDYACFGNNDLAIGKALLQTELKRSISEEENQIIELWYSLQALSWYLVATFKDETGASLSLGLDFKQIASMFLDKAANLLKQY